MDVGPGAALTELAVGDASPLVAGIETQRPFLQCVAIEVGVLDGVGMEYASATENPAFRRQASAAS